MSQKDRNSPATTSLAYDAMVPVWTKIATVLAGTEAMRGAGQLYLHKHEEEGNIAYQERLQRATLLNMTQLTLESWTGRPFSEPVKIGEDVPEQLVSMLDNVDLMGNDINVFARNWFRDGLSRAFSHVLVEFPRKAAREDGQPRSVADDKSLRPYLVLIAAEDLIFAHADVVDGVEVLTHVRIRETVIEQDGFAEVVKNRIRVLTPGHVQLYEEIQRPRSKKTEWVLIDEWDIDLDFIPLVTFYADRQGFMLGKPPLSDLADLNIEHWQSYADQISVLTVARFPILAVSGSVDGDKLTIGPNQWLNTPDAAGRFYYVEHSGKAINSGRQHLLDLEERMAEYGAVFLKRRPGGASATARALDSAETSSPLEDMATRFQSALNQALAFMGAWIKIDYNKTGTLSVNTDLGVTAQDSKSLDSLKEARKNRDISRVRYLKELQRFRVLSDDFDPAKNDQELEDETLDSLTGEAEEDLDPAAQE